MNKKCEICKGTGWLWEDKGVNEEGFGKLVPCECNPEAIAELEIPTPDPQPEPHPALLKWMEYTD